MSQSSSSNPFSLRAWLEKKRLESAAAPSSGWAVLPLWAFLLLTFWAGISTFGFATSWAMAAGSGMAWTPNALQVVWAICSLALLASQLIMHRQSLMDWWASALKLGSVFQICLALVLGC